MTSVKLGQLFLLRRDLKQEISNLSSEMVSLVAYREDKKDTTEEYNTLVSTLSEARNTLHLYDRLIEQVNSKPNTVDYKASGFSLNDARHYKVHLTAHLGHTEMLLRQALSFSKRTERDQVYEPIDPNNAASQTVMKQIEKKFKVAADIKLLKQEVKEVKQDLQLLDSAIQQVDWSTFIELPE